MTEISLDNSSAPVDALGRVRFARHLLALVQAVDAGQGAVVGLEGAWGSGKTWVLEQLPRLMEEVESGQTRSVVIPFNPWMVSGTTGLVETLLLQIAAEVAVQTSTDAGHGLSLAQKIIDYAGALGVLKHLSPVANLLVPGSGLILEGVAFATKAVKEAAGEMKPALDQIRKHLERLSLRAMREAIAEALKVFDRRLVVLIDDLDRLPPLELAATIQAVKAVADFPSVVYVLSYDPRVVANGLEKALGVQDGMAYLEKVVQVPLRVPEVPARILQRHAENVIRGCFQGVQPDAFRLSDLDPAVPKAAALLTTPRQIRRLATRLAVIVRTEPLLCRDINVGDLLLVEALQLVNPDVIAWVDRYQFDVLKAGHERHDAALDVRGKLTEPGDPFLLGEEGRDARKTERQNELDAAVAKQPEIHGATTDALGYLFDGLSSWSIDRSDSSLRFRVQRYRQWYRWRSFVTHDDMIENSELEALLAKPETVANHWVFEDRTQFKNFLALVVDLAGELRNVDGVGFARLMATASTKFSDDELFENSRRLYGPAEAVEAVLRATRDQAKRVDALRILVVDASVVLGFRALKDVRDDLYGYDGNQPKPVGKRLIEDAAVVRDQSQVWAKRALALLADETINWATQSRFSPWILACWLKALDEPPPQIQIALTALMLRSKANLVALLSSFEDHEFYHAPDATIFPEASLVIEQMRLHGVKGDHFTKFQTFLKANPASDEAPLAG